MAQLYGHPRAALMNGGRKKWELEGRELTTHPVRVEPTSYPLPQTDLRLRAFLPDLLQMTAGETGSLAVDVRSPV